MGEESFAYGFQVASYNKSYPLIIDPVLAYSTYLGGSSSDGGQNITVDSFGNVYVTGWTNSINFLTVNPIQGSVADYYDAFVAKINSSGTALVYSTYLGGSGDEWGDGISVDTSGNAYVTGQTASSNFPTVNPIQGSLSGTCDAFVTKINASGTAIVYSTYLGGSDWEEGFDSVVDTSGNVYVTGYTGSTDFPTVNPIQGSNAGSGDVFVAKINSSGTGLVYSTYLGGSSSDYSHGIAVDSSGNAYITGRTTSTNFPTANPIQGSNAGGTDAFIAKLNASGASLVYSTYLGGSSDESGGYSGNIAIDGSGNAYVTGNTSSTNFPTVNPIQGSLAGFNDAFVAKINASGSALIYSTYLGGGSSDEGWGIAVDVSGNAYVTGYTDSTDFPTVNPIQGSLCRMDRCLCGKDCCP